MYREWKTSEASNLSWSTPECNSRKTWFTPDNDELVSMRSRPYRGWQKTTSRHWTAFCPLFMALITVGTDSARRVNCKHLIQRMVSCAGWTSRHLVFPTVPWVQIRCLRVAISNKAISFFMPDHLVLWVSAGCNKRNPMRISDVNNHIWRFK